jgi:hypothetical protein
MRLPEKIDFVGLGPQRCGTTWIQWQLNRHPDIFITQECRLFVPGMGLVRSRLPGARAFGGYDGHDGYDGQTFAGTYHNSYISSPSVLSLLASECAGAKYYVCLRDPLERTLSRLRHSVKRGRLSPRASYEEVVKNDFLRHICIDNSMYDALLASVFRYLDPDRMKLLVFEDLMASPRPFMEDLLSFLGADARRFPVTENRGLSEKVNAGFVPKRQAVERVSRRLTRLGRRLQGEVAGGILAGTAGRAARAVGGGMARLNRDYAPLSLIPEREMAALARQFLPGVRLVEELTGRDLTKTWKHTCSRA